MKKRTFLLILLLLFTASGCMQSKEHLVVNEDGTGTLEAHIKLPTGTVQLIDMMMAGMVQAMSQAFSEEGEGMEQEMPESIAEEMFSEDDIIEKARMIGLKVQFEEFKKDRRADGLYVDYKFQFDDINKLAESGIVSAGLIIKKDNQGNWICETVSDPQKAMQSQTQVEQVKGFKESEEFKKMDPVTRTLMMNAMSDLRFEFLITMPAPIVDYTGEFERVNENTARLYFSGDIFEDPKLLDKLVGMSSTSSRVVWGTGGAGSYDISSSKGSPKGSPKGSMGKSSMGKGSPKDSKPKVPLVKIYLKNGKVFEGELMERTEDYVKMKLFDTSVTFYSDEIDRLE